MTSPLRGALAAANKAWATTMLAAIKRGRDTRRHQRAIKHLNPEDLPVIASNVVYLTACGAWEFRETFMSGTLAGNALAGMEEGAWVKIVGVLDGIPLTNDPRCRPLFRRVEKVHQMGVGVRTIQFAAT